MGGVWEGVWGLCGRRFGGVWEGVWGGLGKHSPKGQIPPATCFVVVLICMQKFFNLISGFFLINRLFKVQF